MLVFVRGNGRFSPDPVGSGERHQIAARVPLHTSSPVGHRIAVKNRFASDCGRIKKHLRPHHRHAPRRFREPLIPADSASDLPICRIEHLEAGVSGREIKFFLIKMIVRNMRLAINAEDFSVRIDHRHRVVGGVSGSFIKAHRQNHLQLLRERLHPFDARILFERIGERIVGIIFLLTEIPSLKKLGEQNDLSAHFGGLPNKRDGFFDVFFPRSLAGHLDDGNGYVSHGVFSFLIGR